MWVFGYGSLVWRPSIAFEERAVCDLEGFGRRFWQGSTDHRGVPGRPGRVLTLIRGETERCRGAAYRVSSTEEKAVLQALDQREKGGYERFFASVQAMSGETLEALVYLATETNPNWLGPASAETIAETVVSSTGPRGPNTEYVLKLDEALVSIDARDQHVHEVARAVRRRMALTGGGRPAAPSS